MIHTESNYRPHVHFTPPMNWMNDPNGLVYLDGEYHLYYQHNPYTTRWGHMSWGHAVSKDLLHWQHLPIAIWEEPTAGYTIFSGSAVIDEHNTAGFGAGAIIAVYTADYDLPEKHQDIHIAYSMDHGRTFQQYDNNPVIAVGEAKFGDPKVFWYPEEKKWVMINICHRPQGCIMLYCSHNLKDWDWMSTFSAEEAAPGIWECPDFFPLCVDDNPEDVKWILKVNNTRHGEGPPATRYFVGDFTGTTFINASQIGYGLTSDAGAIYAEVTYNNEPLGRRVLMGWLRETPHEDRDWTGAMALPRILALRSQRENLVLFQEPIAEITGLRSAGQSMHDLNVNKNLDLEVELNHRAIEVLIKVRVTPAQRVGFRLELATGNVALMGFDATSKKLFYTYGDKKVTSRFDPEWDDGASTVSLRLFLDEAHVELFGEGTAALTTALPFGSVYSTLSLFAEGGSAHVDKIDTWVLHALE